MAGYERNRGFTILELLVTIAVAAIILSYGVPGFFDVVRNSRATANANNLVTALSIARSEAVKRGARVSVCASADAKTCIGSWDQGWIVVVDGAASDDVAPSFSKAEVLRIWPAPSGSPTITVSPDKMPWVRFLPRGSARTPVAMPATYNIEEEGCSDLQARSIELNAVGRTTVTRVKCE